MCRFADRRTQTLPRHLEQAETCDLADLYASAIFFHSLTQAVFNISLIALWAHVDEIDNDQTAEIANTQLPGNF